MSDLDFPLIRKHFCLICNRWIVNQSSDEGEGLYIHDDIEHPDDISKYITNTEGWN